MERAVQVTVLGGVSARVHGEEVELGGRRQRRLLAALAVDPHSDVNADRLIDRIWSSDDLPEDPRRTLRTYLTRMRRSLQLTDVIRTTSEGWRLDPELVAVDSVQLAALVERSIDPSLDAHQRLAAVDEALGLYRGPPFGDLADEPWLRAEGDRLEELRVVLVERRYQAMLDTGKHTDALPGLVAQVETYPLRGRFVGLQMVALFRTGRQAEASRVFQDHRRRLADELGLEPGSELVELDRRILAGDENLRATSPYGHAIRGYRIGEQLGEGAFAVVYRGTQPSLGRDVAVKIIRSELANRPEFIRRFETEAHVVARLEHPRVVPLYDYWREPDRACLVFRYLRGGTLEAQLTRSGPLKIEEAARLVDHIGSALAAAHAAGVVHRDVKPANVFIDENSNYYLGDFGIALEAAELSDPTTAPSAGSPAYAAPEQLRREAVGPTADVHSLAITAFEALTVQLPFHDATSHADLLRRQLNDPIPPVRTLRADVPNAVDQVLARATAKDPAIRYSTIEDFVEGFLDATRPVNAGRPPVRSDATTVLAADAERNPFKGLRAFTEADAGDFRGRERLVDRLTEVLGRPDSTGRIAAVVGPSGIGKSSLVRAGLLPALRRGAVPGSDRWFVTTMLPGRDPFEELGAALLRVATRVPDSMMNLLHQDHRGLARVVKALLDEDTDAEVMVVIDQFEELFTLVEDEAQRVQFLDALEYAITDSRCPLRIVLTMRADFWDRPLRHGSFARLIEHSVVNVTALAPDELERAIVEPVYASGCNFEPGLVSEIAADVADQPGALPLLQYALTELWDRQISGMLTRSAYRELGGVTGALARRAEELHDDASDEERVVIRRIFGRLASLGEGTEDTRRRALRSELVLSVGSDSLIDRFGRARLFSFDRDPLTREPTVEVAHEALLRQWPRLRGWLDEDRDGLRLHRRLGISAQEWDLAGRQPGDLYRGGRLEAAEAYVDEHPDDLTGQESAFVAAGVALQQKEAAAERGRFDQQVRNNRRLRALLSGVGLLLVIALITGGLAFQQSGRADREANDARAAETDAVVAQRQAEASQLDAQDAQLIAEAARFDADIGSLAAEAAARAEDDPQLALLLAAEAYRQNPGSESLGALQRVLIRTDAYLGVLGAGQRFHAVEWVADDHIVAAGPDGVAAFRPNGELVHRIPVPVADTPFFVGDTTIQWTTLMASAGDHVAFVPAASRTDVQLLELSTGVRMVIQHGSEVTGLAVAPDGSSVFTLEDDGQLAAYDAVSGQRRWQVEGHPERIGTDFGDNVAGLLDRGFVSISGQVSPLVPNGAQSIHRHPPKLTVSGDGSTLVTAEQVVVRRWRTDDGAKIGDDQFTYARVTSGEPALAGIDELAVDHTAERFAYVWRHVLYVHRFGDRFAEEGNAVATTGAFFARPKPDMLRWTGGSTAWTVLTDGRVATVDLETGELVGSPITVPLDGVFHAAPSPDGRRIAVASDEGVGVFSLDGDRLLATAVPRDGAGFASVHPDRELISVGSAQMETVSGSQRGALWDIGGDEPVALDHEGLDDYALFFGRDLSSQLSMTKNYELSRFDPETGERLLTYDMPGSWAADYASPDGRYLAIADHFGIEILDFETGERLAVLDDLGIYPYSITMSDSQLIASTLAGTTAIWEIDAWEEPADGAPAPRWTRIDDGELDGSVAVRHSPDGRWLATANPNGSVILRDPDSLEPLITLDAEVEFAGQHVFTFDEEGKYVLLTGRDNTELWDLTARKRVGDPFPNDPDFWAVASDGMHFAGGVGDWVLYWNLNTEQWYEIACGAAGRNLTGAEWVQFAAAESAYQLTCPQWPSGPQIDKGSTLGREDVDRSLDFVDEQGG